MSVTCIKAIAADSYKLSAFVYAHVQAVVDVTPSLMRALFMCVDVFTVWGPATRQGRAQADIVLRQRVSQERAG